MCDYLRIAYIHIFKSGGTSMGQMLHQACRTVSKDHPRAGGGDRKKVRTLSGWPGNKNFHHYNLSQICSEYTCYSAHRDPIERFLSGYHEIMKRRASNNYLSVPLERSRQHLADFILQVVDGREKDPHILPQVYFFQNERGAFRMSTVHWTPLEHARSLLWILVCGKLAYYGCDGPCKLAWEGNFISRSRQHTNGYAIQNFSFATSDLSQQELAALEQYYRQDYCLFHRATPSLTLPNCSAI